MATRKEAVTVTADSKTEETKNVTNDQDAIDEQSVGAANSRSAAELEAGATYEKRQLEQLQKIEADRQAVSEVDDTTFGGKLYDSENFIARTIESFGAASLEIKPAAWVGPGFIVPAERLDELKTLLGKVKNAPKAK